MEFAGQNQLQKVHALDGARLSQRAATMRTSPRRRPGNRPTGCSNSPRRSLISPLPGTHFSQHAVTSGAAQIRSPRRRESSSGSAQPSTGQRTVVTAAKFDADFAMFTGENLHHGSRHARCPHRQLTSRTARPLSTSDSVDRKFLAQGGIESITQQGNVAIRPSATGEAHAGPGKHGALYSGGPDVGARR